MTSANRRWGADCLATPDIVVWLADEPSQAVALLIRRHQTRGASRSGGLTHSDFGAVSCVAIALANGETNRSTFIIPELKDTAPSFTVPPNKPLLL